ncbi:MAG: TonB-dependent receptor [Bacteroidales bacterium]|nr:TonB-dependent receptor [Bacteroidales bacterium]
MKKAKLFFCALFVFMGVTLSAQNVTVSGVVRDASNGEPVPAASVVLKGSVRTGVVSDIDGAYSITVPTGSTLVFSSIGYKNQEIAVNERGTVNVALEPDAESLSDVLVVAYGTAKKESFTGSAQTIKSEQIEKRTVANVTKALDGLAAGIQTTSGSGQPGAGATVRIRGFGSINASSSPLYVVDGVPYDGSISALNPNDIESMTVIKDASAGALYGARGANGVVIVTTKRGGEGRAKVSLKANVGVSSRALPRYDVLSGREWTEDVYYMYKNDYLAEGYSSIVAGQMAAAAMSSGADAIFGTNEKYNPFTKPVTEMFDHTTGKIYDDVTARWDDDWLDLSTNKAPVRQEYQMTVTGGNKANQYMFSLGYLNEDGLVKMTSFERFSGRANVQSQITNWFKTGLNVNFAHNTTNSTSLGSGQSSSSSYNNVFYTCQLMPSVYPMYARNADGSYVLDANGEKVYDWGEDRPAGASAGWNPLANLIDDKYLGASDNLSGRTNIELGGLEQGVLAGLKFSVNLGFDLVNSKSKTYYNPFFGNAVSKNGLAEIENGRTFSYTFNQLLTYDRTFGKHHLDLLAGHEAYAYEYQYLMGYKSGFPFGGLYELAPATTLEDTNSYTNEYRVESWLSRINYDFADKYYISASYRRDGSSRFHKDYRWGDFWSVGASWRVSQENFLKGVNWINNLTLKASYGVQGNDNLGSLYAWQAFYDLGFPNGANPGAVVSSLESKELKWEKNRNLNVGIEARLFGRLSATIEYYNRYTEDMLMEYPMAVSLGFSGYNKNIGNMQNSGLEISLSGDIIRTENAHWTMTWMGSTVHNKVLHLADKPEIVTGNYIIKEGETLYSFYLPESAGVDPATGAKLYWVWDNDENGNPGDKYITDDYQKASKCKRVIGSRMPALYGSWSNDVHIGNFDFSLMTTWSIGGKINDGVYRGLLYSTYIGQAGHVDRLKAWKQPGDVTSIPKIEAHGSARVALTDDELFDASYFAIKNISLGYTIPAKALQAVKIESIRVYASADNIKLFSALKGMDPQYNFTGGTGYSYTPTRTISLGVDINF